MFPEKKGQPAALPFKAGTLCSSFKVLVHYIKPSIFFLERDQIVNLFYFQLFKFPVTQQWHFNLIGEIQQI